MSRKPLVDPDEVVSRVMAAAGKTEMDAPVLRDVAEALTDVGRPDLAAPYAGRAYRMALAAGDAEGAAHAMTLLVLRLGAEGRRVLRQL